MCSSAEPRIPYRIPIKWWHDVMPIKHCDYGDCPNITQIRLHVIFTPPKDYADLRMNDGCTVHAEFCAAHREPYLEGLIIKQQEAE